MEITIDGKDYFVMSEDCSITLHKVDNGVLPDCPKYELEPKSITIKKVYSFDDEGEEIEIKDEETIDAIIDFLFNTEQGIALCLEYGDWNNPKENYPEV